MPTAGRQTSGPGALPLVGAISGLLTFGLGLAIFTLLAISGQGTCGPALAGGSGGIVLGPPGSGQSVGATEYGGPGDLSSGSVGSSGASLGAHPDSYAELGGYTFQTATALGGLPYMTPLRVTWGTHSAIAYKRDIGFGGSSVAGLPRVIDLWWQFAGSLGIPYQRGLWSGPVRIGRPPAAGAADVLGQVPDQALPATSGSGGAPDGGGCPSPSPGGGVALTPGPRARILPGGSAAAPQAAPLAVKAMLAAGNQIAGKPYLYGGGHGLPLNQVAPAYDCSSSVEHLLYGARLLPVSYGAASGELEAFGQPGTGRWVTIYANADHVFMYVAGLRWDTYNAAGPQDGSAGIGWHPLIRSSAGFVVRHPVGL